MANARALTLLALAGCNVSVEHAETRFSCERTQLCPEDHVCREDSCVPSDTPIYPGRFRRTVSINHGGAAAALEVNFPVLVSVDPTTIDYVSAGVDGATVRFTDLAGNLRPHEIDHWNGNGVSTIWVAVDRLEPESDADELFMYWGSSNPQQAQPTAEVWDVDFVAVWHLDDDPALGAEGAVLDSGGADFHGTASVSMTDANVVPAPLGLGLYFDDADDAVIVGDEPAFELPVYSYSFWIRGDAAPVSGAGVAQPIFNADDQFNFSWHNSGDFTQAASHRGTNGLFVPSQIGEPLAGQTWYFISVTFDGAMLTTYVDGRLASAVSHEPPRPTMGALAFGNDPTAVRFAGALDELRVSKIARGPSWVTAIYASMQESFVTLGDLELV